MYKVHDKNGKLTKDYREILNVQFDFYQDLYTSNQNVRFMVRNDSGIKLEDFEHDSLEHEFDEQEIRVAMNSLKKNKTCGCDSLSLEFYQTFWPELKTPLMQLYAESYGKQYLNQSGRWGVINLIPKKGKDGLLVKNWRPLTLLNYEYKILAKAIATRLEKFADKLIGSQQTGFSSEAVVYKLTCAPLVKSLRI